MVRYSICEMPAIDSCPLNHLKSLSSTEHWLKQVFATWEWPTDDVRRKNEQRRTPRSKYRTEEKSFSQTRDQFCPNRAVNSLTTSLNVRSSSLSAGERSSDKTFIRQPGDIAMITTGLSLYPH